MYVRKLVKSKLRKEQKDWKAVRSLGRQISDSAFILKLEERRELFLTFINLRTAFDDEYVLEW